MSAPVHRSDIARGRRNELVDWLLREDPGAPYTTTQIVDVSGVYDGLEGRWDLCHSDVQALRRNGVVCSTGGRPQRYYAKDGAA